MTRYESPDPLTVLRADDLPVAPAPAFAARLRARLESALSLPGNTEGVDMSGTTAALAQMAASPVTPAAPPRPAALPYLTVADARAAIAWYTEALGAAVVGEPIIMPDNRIGHAELAITGGTLYLADEYPELGLAAPAPGVTSVSLMLQVADTDLALERARSHGAIVHREVAEDHGARGATIVDPFGHRWMLTGPLRGSVSRIQHGDIGYVSVWTPDAERAAAFYGHVLGWVYDAVTHQVTNTAQPIGLYSVGNRPTLFCCYAVADLQAAAQAISDAGGQLGDTMQFDIGTVLDATDPQGGALAVYQPSDGRPRPLLNGAGHGELSYVTYEVADSAAFRQFYQRVLHWGFEPGRIDDGWGVSGSRPMAGIAGGSAEPATVPMWTVDDIEGAVARVREAGGTVVAEPSSQSYGISADCRDDQGTRFYLGQF